MPNVNINKTLDILNNANNITIDRMKNIPTEWTVENVRTGNVTSFVINKEEDIDE